MADLTMCGDHQARITNLEKDITKMDFVIEKIRNRLPNWATLTITLLTGMIGYLVAKL